MADILLGTMILGPLLLTYLLKSNAALAFFSLCASEILILYTVNDATQLFDQLNYKAPASDLLNLGILFVPLILTLLLTRRSVRSGGKFLMHTVPALCAGALLALLAVPLLSGTVQADFGSSQIWTSLQKIQAWVIGAGALSSLLLIWFGGLKRYGKHK